MTNYYHLSQSDLNLLQICPPYFEKVYFQKVIEPHNLEYQEKTQWGKSFHLLMQQYNLGLEIDNFAPNNPELIKQVTALINQTQNIWFSSEIKFREAEYQVNYTWNNYMFTVIYDLLVLSPNQATIIDWKTYRQPEQKDKILGNWQTKLYLYVLAEKFNYLPEQIFFDYWFISSAEKIEKYSIQYSNLFHQQIKQDLADILHKFEDLITNFYLQKINFPHHDKCEQCHYRHHFNQQKEKSSPQNIGLTSFDNIEQIEI